MRTPNIVVSVIAGAGIGYGISQPLEATNGTPAGITAEYQACANTLPSHQSVAKIISRACQAGDVELQDTVFSYQTATGVPMYDLPSAEEVMSKVSDTVAEVGPNNRTADGAAGLLGLIASAGVFMGLGYAGNSRRRFSNRKLRSKTETT